MDLQGKKVLVTGASRGIGKAIAEDFYKRGAEVYVNCAVRVDTCLQVCRELGDRAHPAVCDLSQADCGEKLYALTGDVDILVLNASVQYKKSWDSITAADFDDQMYVNLRASLLLMQKYVPYMKKQGWGRIVTIGSVQEIKPHPDMLVYSASKAAQANMVRSLAAQLAGDGITVNNVGPGVVYTERNVEALSDPEYAKKVASLIPMGYYAMPEDCVGVVSMLCSEAGRYITGQSIYVDGGKGL